ALCPGFHGPRPAPSPRVPRGVALPHALLEPRPHCVRRGRLRGRRYTRKMEAEATLTRERTVVRSLGRIGYDAALALQRTAAASVVAGGPETLLLLEHEPVYTLGRNARPEDILHTPERRRALGIAVRETNRGGKVTYHGPGQLVGYPVLNLAPDR